MIIILLIRPPNPGDLPHDHDHDLILILIIPIIPIIIITTHDHDHDHDHIVLVVLVVLVHVLILTITIVISVCIFTFSEELIIFSLGSKYIVKWILQAKETYYKATQEFQPRDFPGCPVIKNLPANAGDMGSIPGLGRFHMQ